jgi:glycosyltransferase involved in cell wall biosynthesis
MQELVKRGAFRYVLIGDVADPEREIEAWRVPAEIEFIEIPCRKLGSKLLWQSGLVREVLRPAYSAFVFLANPNWPSTWLAALLARMLGKRILFWTHGWIAPESGTKRLLRNLFYRLPHDLLLYGQAARRRGIVEGFSADKLHVIFNSLNYEEQREIRESVTEDESRELRTSLFGSADIPVIVCTSRLTAVRGLDLLFLAAKKLAEIGHITGVLLVGSGRERGVLEALARKLGLHVVFFGACYDERTLGQLILASTVTVAPGKVGLTAMHSMAYGIPVVTHGDADHQMPEWEAIIDGWTGGLFTRGDVDDLAQKIQQWTSRPWVDSDTRARCIRVIEERYNPAAQRVLIERALRGEPAHAIGSDGKREESV